MRRLKLYLDTSVWNFYFADDSPEKRDITREFFEIVEKGVYEIFISEIVTQEVSRALDFKRRLLIDLINKYTPIELDITVEAEELAEAYINRNIVSQKKREDALHVDVATVSEMDALITWNYRHLANFKKAELFYSVNLEMGYFKKLEIITPMEVSRYEG